MLLQGSGAGSATVTASIGIVAAEPLLKSGGKSLVQLEVLTEAITYYENGTISGGRSIRAIVERTEPEILQYSVESGSLTVDVELWISTDPVLGVSVVNPGKDLADVVVIDGQPAQRVRIVEIIDEDPGMVHVLAVR